jgi:membrane AbrB-like protein
MKSPAAFTPDRLRRWPKPTQWLALIFLSIACAAVLEMVRLPAALLLGPMIAGIVLAVNGASVNVPHRAFEGAQAIIGCLVAGSITSDFLTSLSRQGLLFCSVALAALFMSALLGYLLTRWRVLPGTTAVWGSSPGAASAMVLMAEANGADMRLVAFMQYMRVIVVALCASLVARIWVSPEAEAAVAEIVWFPPVRWPAFGLTLLVAAVGAIVGLRLRIPAGAMLGPLALGAILHATMDVSMALPQWFLALSYAVLGWRVGLGFNRQILRHAARATPQIMASILFLVAFCGCLAWMLTVFADVDPLTAYLATSPGGLDSVAIIAATTHVDVAFVITLQTMRLVLVILLGPAISTFVARHALKDR